MYLQAERVLCFEMVWLTCLSPDKRKIKTATFWYKIHLVVQ